MKKDSMIVEKEMEVKSGEVTMTERKYPDAVYEEEKYYRADPKRSGMEMVQVAVLICIAVAVGLVFKEKIMQFVDSTFDGLLKSGF